MRKQIVYGVTFKTVKQNSLFDVYLYEKLWVFIIELSERIEKYLLIKIYTKGKKQSQPLVFTFKYNYVWSPKKNYGKEI